MHNCRHVRGFGNWRCRKRRRSRFGSITAWSRQLRVASS